MMTGVERIRSAFSGEQPAFMPYAVLGYPTPEGSMEVVKALVEAGADVLELGVPFSDPLADGPTIQAATQQALAQGMTVARCIQLVADLRAQGVETPALLMGYVNPILAYGVARFVADSAEAGVDGFIVPDMPPEEAGELAAACQARGLALIYLLAPTSTPERIALVTAQSEGFIYLVSLVGVTGARTELPPGLTEFVQRVRAQTGLPLAVGFGIGTGPQARSVGYGVGADGVIVGSALVKQAAKSVASVKALASEIRQALEGD
jgi:tryptophan synthase alpha chain